MTVRVKGRSSSFEAGEVVPTAQLLELAASLASGHEWAPRAIGSERDRRFSDLGDQTTDGARTVARSPDDPAPTRRAPRCSRRSGHYEAAFRDARRSVTRRHGGSGARPRRRAVGWVADTLQSDELDRGRAACVRWWSSSETSRPRRCAIPPELFGPFVDLLVEEPRTSLATERRFAEADAVRDGLASLGIEIHDTPEGSTWDAVLISRHDPAA